MGVLAPKATLLFSIAASVCQAHLQLAKELLPFAQTRLNPLVLGELGSAQISPVSPVSPVSPFSSGSDISTAMSNASDAFFVYHSRDFAGGKGISIITTPERTQWLAKTKPPADTNDFSSPPPYQERHIPGKGRGLVATKMLHRGDRIMADTPILLVDADAVDTNDARWAALPPLAVDKLPPSSQQLFWNLHHQPGRDAVMGRIDPNAFELDLDDGLYYGVFPEISRLNHDCRPNAVYYFDAHTLTQHIHAVTDIAPGMEISITYIGPLQSRAERAAQLLHSWDFNCSCSACTQSPELTRLSDRRIADMDDLADRLYDDDDGGGGWESAPPQMAETLVSLFRQERLYAEVFDGFLLAALAHCASGNYWDTVKYAHLAVEAVVLYDGTNYADMAMLSGLAAKPDGEECWMRRTRRASA